MEWLGKALILGGLLAIASMQVTAAILVVKSSVGNAVLAFSLPGYILIAPVIKRHPHYRMIIGTWVGGVLAIAAGTLVLA